MKYLPIGIIGAFSIIVSFVWMLIEGDWAWNFFFLRFMGSFLCSFGLMKIVFFKGFVTTFSQYDLLAKKTKEYAYAYPFIELLLGIGYLFLHFITILSIITFILMLIGAVGILLALRQKKVFLCACVGGKWNIPLSTLSLIENLLMAAMAFLMLAY